MASAREGLKGTGRTGQRAARGNAKLSELQAKIDLLVNEVAALKAQQN